MNNIKRLREEKGWTQDDLGLRLNVKRPAVSKYENGKVPLTGETLKKLSEIFNVSIDFILGSDTPKDETPKKPKDLLRFLDNAEVMFDGETYNLSDDDKAKIRAALEVAFWEARKKNQEKRKKKT